MTTSAPAETRPAPTGVWRRHLRALPGHGRDRRPDHRHPARPHRRARSTPTLGERQHRRPGPGRRRPRRTGQRPRPTDPVGRPGPRRPGEPSPASGHRGRRPRRRPQTPYELGSITKTFTGMLLADAVQRGEMAVEDPLAKYLPELRRARRPGEVTLFELATHSSGLPPIAPTGSGTVLAAWATRTRTTSPSRELIEATKTIELKNPGEYAYSNLGMSLLGHAEARAAGAADWPTLVTDTAAHPAADDRDHLRPDRGRHPGRRRSADTGRTAGGRPTGTAQAYLPAGSSTWTTAERHDPVRPGGADEPGARNGRAGAARPKPTTARSGWPGRSARSGTAGDHLAQRRHRRHAHHARAGPGAAGRAWSCWATPAAGSTGPDWVWRASDGPPAAVDRPALPGIPAWSPRWSAWRSWSASSPRPAGQGPARGRHRADLRVVGPADPARLRAVDLRARLDLGRADRGVGRAGGVRGAPGSGPADGCRPSGRGSAGSTPP